MESEVMRVRTRHRSAVGNRTSAIVEFRNPAQQADESLVHEAVTAEEEDFPLDCLPEPVRNIVRAVSEKFQTPTSLAAVNALGVLAAAIGSGLQIRTFNGEKMPANLFLVAIAPPASGKSRVSKPFVTPFERLEEEAFEQWQNTKVRARNEMEVAYRKADYLRNKAAKEADETKSASYTQELNRLARKAEQCSKLLIPPRYICQDSTEQKLEVLMMQNGGTMFVYDADARNILSNILGRYDKDGETSEGVLLKGFSGDPLRVDRIGRDPVWVKQPCITFCVSVQPDKFQKLLSSNAMHESGFICRLLFCDTHAEPQLLNGDVDCSVPGDVQAAWDTLIEELFRASYRNAEQALEVRCMPAALKLFEQFHNEHVQSTRNGASKLPQGYALRSAEKAFRVALCLHAAEHPDCAIAYGLREETARNAIAIVRWFDKDAASLLRERMDTRFEAEMQRVLTLTRKPQFSSGITANEVHQYTKWDTEKCVRVLEALVASGKLLRRETTGRNGKATTIYSPACNQRG
jgi:replicative DNA helicase